MGNNKYALDFVNVTDRQIYYRMNEWQAHYVGAYPDGWSDPDRTYLYANRIGSYNNSGRGAFIEGDAVEVSSEESVRNALYARWQSGETPPGKLSPCVTGQDGQLASTIDSTQNTQPVVINLTPTYNVNNYNINPLPSLQEYSGLVDTLEQNVANNISNENIVRPFLDPFLVPRSIIDNPVDPVPQPTTAPSPITPIPSIIPPQPTAAPLPTLAPEDETEVPKYMSQPDLTSKFPFCIPFDLALIFALFNSDVRQAPVFDWELNFGPAGTYNIHIDFSPYDPAAALFRLLMLIFFVFSLALGTHRLIHPEGP